PVHADDAVEPRGVAAGGVGAAVGGVPAGVRRGTTRQELVVGVAGPGAGRGGGALIMWRQAQQLLGLVFAGVERGPVAPAGALVDVRPQRRRQPPLLVEGDVVKYVRLLLQELRLGHVLVYFCLRVGVLEVVPGDGVVARRVGRGPRDEPLQ